MIADKENANSGRMRQAGMTLVGLIVTMAIIAILASIAYPTYVNQIRKSKRAVAISALLDSANRQEQYFFEHKSYADAMNKLQGYTSSTGTTIYFDKNSTSTPSSSNAVYGVSVAAVDASACGTAPCFQLQAAPLNDQSNDACGTYTLTSSNGRDVSNSTTTPASQCW